MKAPIRKNFDEILHWWTKLAIILSISSWWWSTVNFAVMPIWLLESFSIHSQFNSIRLLCLLALKGEPYYQIKQICSLQQKENSSKKLQIAMIFSNFLLQKQNTKTYSKLILIAETSIDLRNLKKGSVLIIQNTIVVL